MLPETFTKNEHFLSRQIKSQISELQKKGDNDSLSLVKILNFLYYGYEKTKIEQKRNSLLIFGNTGSGKTSISAFLSGLDLRVVKDCYGFYALDYANQENQKHGKIGQNHIESETFIPNKFQNYQYGIDIWDLPGNNDTRGDEIDIVNSYFMHKIIHSVAGIKFVFVIDGQSLNQGLGPERGKALKQIFEMIYIFTLNSQIDFSKNLIFIINKASKKQQFYVDKIRKIFLNEVNNSQDYQQQLKQNIQMKNAQQFFSKVVEAKILLIPVAQESQANNIFESRNLRDQLLMEIQRSEYYYNKDLRTPFTVKSLDKVRLMWRYSQELVRVTFDSLCQTLVSEIEQLSLPQIKNLEQKILNLEPQFKKENTNLKKFLTIHNNLIQPFQESICSTHKNDLNQKVQLIIFLLSEIYDEILINIQLQREDKEYLCKFGSQETKKGLQLIRMNLEQQQMLLQKLEIIREQEKMIQKQEQINQNLQDQKNNNQIQINQLSDKIQCKQNEIHQVKSKIRVLDQQREAMDQSLNEQKRQIEDCEQQKRIIDQKIKDSKQQIYDIEYKLSKLKKRQIENLYQIEKEREYNQQYEEKIMQTAIHKNSQKQENKFLTFLSNVLDYAPLLLIFI
ncbi:hypothetical protein ABPG74_000550 [Tetrahymena malaccensis]